MERDENELKEYVVKEYAYPETFNRHYFVNTSKQKPQTPNGQQFYSSYFYHPEDIIEYYNTHKNPEGKNTLEGYSGPVYSDELKIDIDEKEKSLEIIKKLIFNWVAAYNLDSRYIKINFSGSKGFHIRIPATLFDDFGPSESLPDIHKKIATKLTEGIKIDETVYKTIGLFREVNSVNSKSGLYAIPLTIDEALKLSYDEIRDLAKTSRDVDYIDVQELAPITELVALKENQVPDNTIKTKKPKDNNLWQGTIEGNRFKNQTSAIGKLIHYGLPHEDIMGIGLLLNKQNNPPKTEALVKRQINDLIKKYAEIEGNFWKINKENQTVEIVLTDYLSFLQAEGFVKFYLGRDYVFIRKIKNICSEYSLPQVKDHVLNYLDNLTYPNKDNIREFMLDKVTKYFGEGLIECINTADIKFKRDEKDKAYIYFKEGFAELTKNSDLGFKPYDNLESPIWESSIIKRDFVPFKNKYKSSEFEQFLRNAVGGNEERLLSLCSAIGYLIHDYKDKSNTKAVILCDEKISDNPMGRTGKSLIGKAISYIKNIVRVDGKNFEFKSSFTFQLISLDNKVIDFNDVKSDFDFERLFSVITDDMTVEYKNKQPFTIKYEESPKIMISTNYTIQGLGDSYKDRMFEIEFSDFYNEQHKPIHDFGHNFFDGWDNEEWNRFYNFMLECLQLYLDEGLISFEPLNLSTRKLIDSTSSEFVDFVNDSIITDCEYDKESQYQKFKEYLGFDNNGLWNNCPVKKNTFTRWLKIYSNFKEMRFIERSSNGRQYFTVKK